MPTREDLAGLGMAPSLAAEIGNSPALITATGTTQGAAAAIKTHLSEVNAQSAQQAVIIPSAAKVGTPYWVQNGTTSATAAFVFVPVGHFLNGTLNGSLSLAQNKLCVLQQYKKSWWGSILTA